MSNVPAGFAPITETPILRETDRVIDPETLKNGSILTFDEVVNVPKGTTSYRLFLFKHEQRPGQRFGLWATGQLERLLRDVKPGTRLYLRYDGLQPNPRIPDGKVHTWTVAREQASSVELPAASMPAAESDFPESDGGV